MSWNPSRSDLPTSDPTPRRSMQAEKKVLTVGSTRRPIWLRDG